MTEKGRHRTRWSLKTHRTPRDSWQSWSRRLTKDEVVRLKALFVLTGGRKAEWSLRRAPYRIAESLGIKLRGVSHGVERARYLLDLVEDTLAGLSTGVDLPAEVLWGMPRADEPSARMRREFYRSDAWAELRAMYRRSAPRRCARCKREEDLVVDHVIPIRKAWDRRLDPDNLQILCRSCNLEKRSHAVRRFPDGGGPGRWVFVHHDSIG